jgi:hypothetical protein
MITINLTKKDKIKIQIIKVIDNAHNHLFTINFYATPNDKHNALGDPKSRLKPL